MSEFIKAIRALGFWRTIYLRCGYRYLMRLSHRFNWHYMEPMHGIQPDNDTQIWCHWCGARYTLPRRNLP